MGQVPSVASQIIVTIIPIVGIVIGGTVIFFWLYWSYKQRMLMIEKNITQIRSFDLESFGLLTGLILTSLGACLGIFFIIIQGLSYGMLSGLIPFSIGISMIAFYIIRRKTRGND